MERRLYNASIDGDREALSALLKDDPSILDRINVTCFNETPLHIVVMKGHVDLARDILQLNSQLARELDSRNCSPLHIASRKGNVRIVKVLLEFNTAMCFAQDEDGRNPLHIAAMKGHVTIVKVLVQKRSAAALQTLFRGETILHLCVKHNQLKVLKMLIQKLNNFQFLNAKDDDDNTVLHLAVGNKQIKTIKYLLLNTSIELNAVNLYGLTAMDILIQSPRDLKDMDIKELLIHAGAVAANGIHLPVPLQNVPRRGMDIEQHENWLERKRNTLMIVASLIATMAFQAGINPPGGVWQETKMIDSKVYQAGHSIWAYNNPHGYRRFSISTTISFISSLSIILLLISGVPLKRRVFIWILMVIMWISITTVAFTYGSSVVAVTNFSMETTVIVLWIVHFIWFTFMATLILVHLVRFITRRRRLESNPAIVNNHDV